MNDFSKVRWKKIREYLLQLGSCRTREDFLHTASAEVQSLIPFDAAAGIFSTSDAAFLAGVGMSGSVNECYNRYYRTRQPWFLNGRDRHLDIDRYMSAPIVEWRKFDYLELASDFMMPNGMHRSISWVLPGHEIVMSIHCSRLSPNFTESSLNTLQIISTYLNSYYSSLEKRTGPAASDIAADEISRRFLSLSTREAEVCSLLVRRLNTFEIAALLFISPRTVEKHTESIFDKLSVHSREQLRWRLGVLSS